MATLVAFRVDDETNAYLEELALKHRATKSEIIRRFVCAGVDANPLSDEERAGLRRAFEAARQKRGAEMPGLVVPLPDLVASGTLEKKEIEPVSTTFGRILQVRRAA